MRAFLLTSLFFASTLFAVAPNADAPAFSLKSADGKMTSLPKGKWVVLEWLNYDCPFVKKFYNEKYSKMQALQSTYTAKGKDVVWYSIISGKNKYSPKDILAKTKALGAHPTAVLLDPSGKVGHDYDAKTTPHIFILNPAGKVIYQGAIDSGDAKKEPSTEPDDIKTATNYVTETLEAAMNGRSVSVASTVPYGCSVKY